MAKDLVCGMDVDENTVEYKTEYEGKMYYFCALGCKKSFDEEPEKYISGEAAKEEAMHPQDDDEGEMHHEHMGEEKKEAEEKPWWKFW